MRRLTVPSINDATKRLLVCGDAVALAGRGRNSRVFLVAFPGVREHNPNPNPQPNPGVHSNPNPNRFRPILCEDGDTDVSPPNYNRPGNPAKTVLGLGLGLRLGLGQLLRQWGSWGELTRERIKVAEACWCSNQPGKTAVLATPPVSLSVHLQASLDVRHAGVCSAGM